MKSALNFAYQESRNPVPDQHVRRSRQRLAASAGSAGNRGCVLSVQTTGRFLGSKIQRQPI